MAQIIGKLKLDKRVFDVENHAESSLKLCLIKQLQFSTTNLSLRIRIPESQEDDYVSQTVAFHFFNCAWSSLESTFEPTQLHSLIDMTSSDTRSSDDESGYLEESVV